MSETVDWQNEEAFQGTMAADWIQDLESSDSRLHKESVIEKALMAARLGSASAQCFLYNAYLALNPFFVYGVKKVPESAGLTDRANPWVSFWALCESLRTRSVTGGDARSAIDDMMQRFDSEQWNGLARRVLIKDLRCGVSEKTINKICGRTEYAIPTFECQLAQDSGDHPARMRGRKRLEVKLDGVRVLAMCYVRSGTVNLMSRNGKAFTNFGHIEQQLIPHITRISMKMFNTGTDFVLAGETLCTMCLMSCPWKTSTAATGTHNNTSDWKNWNLCVRCWPITVQPSRSCRA